MGLLYSTKGTPSGGMGSMYVHQINEALGKAKSDLNPLILQEFLQKLLSGSMILSTITWKLKMVLQNI